MYLPEWIQAYKEPRTGIKRINNGFYKYEVAFTYNPNSAKLGSCFTKNILNIKILYRIYKQPNWAVYLLLQIFFYAF